MAVSLPTPQPSTSRNRFNRQYFSVPITALLVLCAVLVSAGALARPLFPNPAFPFGSHNLGLTTTDLDDDGRTDLIGGQRDNAEILVLMGNGDGTFTLPVAYSTDPGPWSTAVGDFNEDGRKDVAVSEWCGGITVFMGNGDGTLDAGTDYDNEKSSFAISIGDFNGDGHEDLITTARSGGFSCQPATVLYLGHGDGTFTDTVLLDSGDYHVAVDDFDGDALDDFALSGGGVYLSNGDGTFNLAENGRVGGDSITAGDLNDDNIPDLVLSYVVSSDLRVFLGIGDGTFGPAQLYPVDPSDPNASAQQVAIADIDNDGLQDLAVNVSGSYPHRSLALLFGTGGGQFAEAVAGDWNGSRHTLVIEDFDGDEAKDLVRSWWHGNANLLLGRGDGTFITVEHESVDPDDQGLVAGDLDGDGRVDVAMFNEATHDVAVLLADGAGSFAPPNRFCVRPDSPPCPTSVTPKALAVAEVTGDSHLDFLVARGGTASAGLSVLEGDGAGGFSYRSSKALVGGVLLSAVVAGDLDNDNKIDAVVADEGSSDVHVLLGNGDGTFALPPWSPPSAGTTPKDVVLGLLDDDSFLDIAVANSGSDDVSVFLGNGDGSFVAAPVVVAGSNPTGVGIGDLDGDAILDLVVVNSDEPELGVYLGSGDGTFVQVAAFPFGHPWGPGYEFAVSVGDLNDDSIPDLATTTYGHLSVLLGKGDGSFEPERMFKFVGADAHLVVADFNLDHRTDIAGKAEGSSLLSIFLNQSGPTAFTFLADHATLVWPAVAGALSYDIYRGDTSLLFDEDDDGLPDSGYGACMTAFDEDPRDVFFVDADLPESGGGFFYLMSVLDAGGDQGLGTTSAGLARIPEVPCP